MEETIVSKQNMESIKALSDVNLKISDAKNTLFRLQEEETDYLILREKKAMERIQKVIDDSKEMIKEADENHGQIKELIIGVTQISENLTRLYSGFQDLSKEFEERNVLWEADIGKQQDDIAEARKEIKIEKVQIENDKKSIQQTKVKQENDQKKLDSDRGTVQRAIERLKSNII